MDPNGAFHLPSCLFYTSLGDGPPNLEDPNTASIIGIHRDSKMTFELICLDILVLILTRR